MTFIRMVISNRVKPFKFCEVDDKFIFDALVFLCYIILPLVKTILEELEKEYLKFKEKGFLPVRSELKSYSNTLGRHVSVTTSAKKKISGKAIDINENGALIVESQNGTFETILSGDVTLVR